MISGFASIRASRKRPGPSKAICGLMASVWREIDLSNSQSSFAALVAKQRGHEDPAFLKLCEEGTVYDYFMQFGQEDLGRPYTREEVKTEFNERLLFCKNGYRSKIKSAI